jgi:hypothetical protein
LDEGRRGFRQNNQLRKEAVASHNQDSGKQARLREALARYFSMPFNITLH